MNAGAPDMTTPRGKCYHAIRHTFSDVMVAHYKKHPDLLTEPSVDALQKLLLQVLGILDCYEIEAPPK